MKARVKTLSQIRKTLDTFDSCNGVSFTCEMGHYCGKVIDVKPTIDGDFDGEDWFWSKEWLMLDYDSPIEAIIFKDRVTTIIGKDGHKYSATCADGEVWDYEKGAMAAAMRMPCRVDYKDIAPYLQH